MVVIGLGTVWILDGLEVTIVGSIAPRLTESGSGIAITTAQIGTAAAVYVAGACVGALFFGQLTDRFGRKKLFLITLGALHRRHARDRRSWTAWFFFLCRFFTGAGIGGEYAAINSAIDELIPARVRGRVDLIINGSYWVGAAAGSAAAILLLDKTLALGERRLADLASCSARSSGSASSSSAATCPRARAGCSSTAARRRPSGSSARSSRTSSEETGEHLERARADDHRAAARVDPVPRDRQDRLPALPAARDPRPRAVHRPGVPLQRRHVQPRDALHDLLRRLLELRPGLPHRLRGRELPRPAAPRAGSSTRSGASR